MAKVFNNNNNNTNNNNRTKRHSFRSFTISSLLPANCLQHVRSSGLGSIVYKSCATHRALITCDMQCATWYEGTAQLLKIDRVELEIALLQLYFY